MVEVSVIVSSFNGLQETTQPCLESIFQQTTDLDYEVIVVDNGSGDGTREYLARQAAVQPRLRWIANAENLGYAAANNQGIAAAKGECLILLNSDTVVTPQALGKLASFLAANAEVGLVGPVTNCAGNEQQIFIQAQNLAGALAEGRMWTGHSVGDRFESERLGFFCVALRRELTRKVGVLDEAFGLGFYEDDDYCLRSRQAGYRLVCVEEVFVYHRGSQCFKQRPPAELKRLMETNRRLFAAKHGRAGEPARACERQLELARDYLRQADETSRPRLLYKTANRLAMARACQPHSPWRRFWFQVRWDQVMREAERQRKEPCPQPETGGAAQRRSPSPTLAQLMQRPEFLHEYDLDSLVLVHPKDRNFSMYVTPRYRQHYEELPFEAFSADLVTSLLPHIPLFIDVGAHYGFYTLLAGKRDSRVEVMACEPTPETCSALERNVALNDLKNVTVHQIALSDKDGTISFNVSLASDSCGFHPNPVAPPLRQIEVITRRLDTLLAEHAPCPTLIKIDTEGHEVPVLIGLSGTLESFPDVQLLVEFNPLMQRAAGYAEGALLTQLEDMGFSVYFLHEKAHCLTGVRDQKQLSKLVHRSGYGNIYCTRNAGHLPPVKKREWLKHCIDEPRDWKLQARDLNIQGWCFGVRGTVIQGVRARRGDHVWNARYWLPRPDVAEAYPHERLALRTGFDVNVKIPIFPGRLVLEAQDQFGQWRAFHSRFVSRWRSVTKKHLLRPGVRRQKLAQALPKVFQSLRFKHLVFAVSHSDYRIAVAGTQKLLQQEEALLAARGISYIEIHPAPQQPLKATGGGFLAGLYVDGQLIGEFDLVQVRQILAALARAEVKILMVHLHHLMGVDLKALRQLLDHIPAPRRFFIHDFFSVCKQVNLLKNDRQFCGGPPLGSPLCGDCGHGRERAAHMGAFQKLFQKWDPEFVAPSPLAAETWGGSFPALASRVRIVPHMIEEPAVAPVQRRAPGGPIRIAYVGYQHPIKGWEEWKRLASLLPREHYELYILGNCLEFPPDVKYVPVSFIEQGPDAMTRALREHAIDLAFLWSLVPETYSFTLYESMAAGTFVLTNPHSGNMAAQVRQTGRGLVAKDLEELLAFLQAPQRVAACLEQFRAAHPPFELVPNPALAEGLAARLPARPAAEPQAGRAAVGATRRCLSGTVGTEGIL